MREKPMLRPGNQKVPIQVAPSNRVYADPELTNDFNQPVFGLEGLSFRMSPVCGTSTSARHNQLMIDKIRDLCDVDVSDTLPKFFEEAMEFTKHEQPILSQFD